MLDEAALFEVLGRMPPRSAELVSRVALDGWSLPELAERFGIPEANAARLVLRAARDLEAAAQGASTPAPPVSDEVEASRALALAHALERLRPEEDGSDGGASHGPATASHDRHGRAPGQEPSVLPNEAPASASDERPSAAARGVDASADEVRPLAELLAALATHRDGLKRRLADAEAAAARSPARAREVWLRRLAIAVILALTAYFYWRDQHAPPPPSLPRPALPPGGH